MDWADHRSGHCGSGFSIGGDWAMNTSAPLALVALFALQTAIAAVQGGEAVIRVITPPAIEGVGSVSTPVHAGKTTLVNWEIIKRTDCPGTNSRLWTGEDGYELREPLGATTLPVTESPVAYAIQTHIPEGAPQGVLRLWIKGEYVCAGQKPTPFSLGPVTMTVE